MPLVCTIELSKTAGVTITVENADDKITQTIVMNGTSIVTTVKGQDATSKVTQLQDLFKVEVKDFVVNAETITCTSTKATSHKSDDTFTAQSAKDMTLKSDAKVTALAGSDCTIKSTGKTTIQATGDLAASGNKVDVKANTDATIKGNVNATFEGGAKAVLKAAQVEATATATATVKGAILNLEGQVENLKGTMVKIG